MCDCQPTDAAPRVNRRRALGLTAAAAGAAAIGAVVPRRTSPAHSLGTPSVEVTPGLRIARREAWGPDLPPTGPIGPEDVRFLLVHHTFSSNDVADVRALLRSVYAFHTGPEKRWPDIAYHFMIAPDGGVWETRAGSLDGPVVADATGGNQGFAQLVCLIGDYTAVPPTPAAQESLVRVLWWLADRYDVGTARGDTATFVSRGSNKLARGTTATVRTISGHRDCTLTACPGDAAYGLIPRWRALVHANRLHATPDEDAPYRTARRLGVHLS